MRGALGASQEESTIAPLREAYDTALNTAKEAGLSVAIPIVNEELGN